MKKDELEASLRQTVYSVFQNEVAYIYVKVDSYGNVQGFYWLDSRSITYDKQKKVYIQKWADLEDTIIPTEKIIEINKKGFPNVKN